MQWTRGTLFDRRVHGDYRRARSRRPLTRCFDGKTIASLISGLRLVFVGGCVELFQLAVCRLLQNVRATHCAADRDRKQAAFPGLDADVAGRVLTPIRQLYQFWTVRRGQRWRYGH